MKLKQQLGLSLVVGGGLLFGLSTSQTTAHASTYLRYYQNIPNKQVSVTNGNAAVYTSARLSHRAGTMRYYGSKVEEYYAAHVTRNGRASVYYKFRAGHYTGWVWHGYLKSIGSSTGTTSTTKPTNTSTTNNGGNSSTTAPIDSKLQAESIAQDKQILSMFPNSVQDPTLMKVANGLENDPAILVDDDAGQIDDDINRIMSPLSDKQKAQVLTIERSGSLSLQTLIQSGKISWSNYLEQDMAQTTVQTQPTAPTLGNYSRTPSKYDNPEYHEPSYFPTLYKGWKIGVGSFPKDGDSDRNGYGSYTVLLLPPDVK